jgi:hypothetical protein
VARTSEVTSIWACPPCEAKLLADKNFLRTLGKRRYLDHKCETIGKLRAFDLQLETMRLDMEEIMDESLKSKRAERAKAALIEIGKIHGENYKNLSYLRR